MSTEPYRQAVEVTRSVLQATTDDQMESATPCSAWQVSDLINHIVGAQHFFLAGLNGTPPSGGDENYAEGNYLAAYDAATSAALEAFSADGIMAKPIAMPFGEMPGAAVMGLATTDTFQHGWDLAKAIGHDTDLAPDLAASLLEQSKMSIQEGFRGPEGAPFGPEQQAPEGATNADRLAAFLGRSV